MKPRAIVTPAAVIAIVLCAGVTGTPLAPADPAIAAPAVSASNPPAPAGADLRTGEQVLEGEIIDLDCYLLDPVDGRGPEHNECARHCLADGKPSALLAGDRLYLIIGAGQAVSHEEMGVLAGFPVKLTGNVVVQNGVAFVFLEGVERVGTGEDTEGKAKE